MDPLVSAWCPACPPQAYPAFAHVEPALDAVTPQGLALLDGFSTAALLPSGKAPSLADISFPPAVQLVVSRMPPGGMLAAPGGADPPFTSLMLHGWLFESFAASDRKAHQKFPLISVSPIHNILPAPGGGLDPPVWLPTATRAFGWADQHVHRDEPVDLGGFLFAEVFFGSDMARVGVTDKSVPAAVWVVAVDSEDSRGLVTLCVMLPDTSGSEADTQMDAELKHASTPSDVATALTRRYGAHAETIAAQVESLHGRA